MGPIKRTSTEISFRFPDEIAGLSLFRNYSQDACVLECVVSIAKEECGCLPWYIPRPDDQGMLCKYFNSAITLTPWFYFVWSTLYSVTTAFPSHRFSCPLWLPCFNLLRVFPLQHNFTLEFLQWLPHWLWESHLRHQDIIETAWRQGSGIQALDVSEFIFAFWYDHKYSLCELISQSSWAAVEPIRSRIHRRIHHLVGRAAHGHWEPALLPDQLWTQGQHIRGRGYWGLTFSSQFGKLA